MDLAFRSFEAQAVHAAASLGIADHLEGRSMGVEDLAREGDAHAPSLRRLLRALVGMGLFAEPAPGCFQATDSGRWLSSGIPGSVRDSVLVAGGPLFHLACGGLADAVRSGSPAFERIHGMGFYDYLAAHPEAGRLFHSAMAGHSDAENDAIAGAYDFRSFRRVADVGGGQGGQLAAILRAAPGLQGVLFDRSADDEAGRRLSEAGVADRCEICRGDFFEEVPRDCDAYILKRVIQDCDDRAGVRILKNCRDAAAPGGKVLVIERVVSDEDEPSPGGVADLVMMVLLPGRERTEREFRELFARAGLELTATIGTPHGQSILAGELA